VIEEVWIPVPNYEHFYMASAFGRIKSLKSGGMKGKLLTPQKVNSRGYFNVCLCNQGSKNMISVHRVIALTFIPNPDNKPEVNHKDGNKTNNEVSNLEWCTGSENMNHAYRTGLQKPSENQKTATSDYCKDNFSKKVIQFDLNGNIVNEYPSASEAARETGFCQTHISSCCRGKVKTCHNYNFSYA